MATSNPLTLLESAEFLDRARQWITENTPEELTHVEGLCWLTQFLQDSALAFFASEQCSAAEIAYGQTAYLFLVGYASAQIEREELKT